MTIYGKSPVFPESEIVEDGNGLAIVTAVNGLTKREYFAALAMQGILAGLFTSKFPEEVCLDWVSEQAVDQADELIAAFNKEGDD